ncbi:MAG TPA: hypothetical protein PK073_00310 [Ignavibacteriaceae bacterium]|nr:MAG: hypothetical protein BWY38_01540 [Ignavibacteria bacterium ADurb.Bin266]OQY71207.1 MAG: hypothetical protein B6D44_13540 [Ignavibacteriales bacterium UTCHB2]HQF41319.1 hypothetical protein [Ignavibacteriaceae bacterium]HQI40326.1 hypothetical protein [Ignavibacteriaceae bacterium]HQJ46078.1 hypothetical protein [Ignavibacteriaceae bacterium]
MKTIIQILSCLFFFSLTLFSQTDKNHLKHPETDTSKIKIGSDNLEGKLYIFNEFALYNELNNYKNQLLLNDDPNTVWLKTSLLISKKSDFNQEFSPYFLEPLEQQYQRDSKFNLFRYALGMIQTGAAGYLAYKHIKKYGFWK